MTMLLIIGCAYCQSPLEKAGDVVSPPDSDVVLDTIYKWFAEHDKGKITVIMYDILIICRIITVILTFA